MTTTTAVPQRNTIQLPYRHETTHFIGGSWVSSHGKTCIDVIDPATNQVWGSAPAGDQQDVNDAVDAAHNAFTKGPWASTTARQRAVYLEKIAEQIELRAEALALTNTLENGSPIAETSGAAANAASIFRYFATLADHIDTPDIRPFPSGIGESVVQKDPIGVCALIAPWNFPINLMVTKLAPALLAGCTVVMKPASTTPLSFRLIVDAVAAAGVPDGVVNYVTGPGRMGDLMVRHPKVSKVAFTGSTPVGRHIAAACGELLRPVTLELGGKSSAIVLEDVDLTDMSARLIRSCMRNTGQTCYISTRILAPASRYEEIIEAVTATISEAVQGDPLDPLTVFGPSANQGQYETVIEYLKSAQTEGARVTTGGKPAHLDGDFAEGYFIQPTVIADVTAEMRVAREEIFGPVITILPYESVEDAIELANNTEFGLGGIVFSADEQAGFNVARQIDSGSVGVNFFASNHAAPFGGRHDSGLGVEYGPEGLASYLTYKSIHRIS